MNIFVAKLNPETTSEELKALFAEYGTVQSCRIIQDRSTGRSKCYGFVKMPKDAEAITAIGAMDGARIHKYVIVAKQAEERRDNANRNRGGNGTGQGSRRW